MDDLDWAAILGNGGGLRQGYFKLSIEPVSQPNPFIGGPHLAGSVRIEAPASRAAVPLFNTRGDEFFFTPVRADADVYTGLSILNDGPEEIEVIIEAYDANGRLLDATEEALVQPQHRMRYLPGPCPDSLCWGTPNYGDTSQR